MHNAHSEEFCTNTETTLQKEEWPVAKFLDFLFHWHSEPAELSLKSNKTCQKQK